MGRTQHTNNVSPKVEEESRKSHHDGTLPQGVTVEAYYDRGSLVEVTTHTVLHKSVLAVR